LQFHFEARLLNRARTGRETKSVLGLILSFRQFLDGRALYERPSANPNGFQLAVRNQRPNGRFPEAERRRRLGHSEQELVGTFSHDTTSAA
jgi:hypothetical protein